MIMTRRGYVQLDPSHHDLVDMPVFQRVSYSFIDKKYVPDDMGELKLIDYVDHIDEAPPRYKGPIPSFEALSYIKRCERASAEWAERRASKQALDVEEVA